MYVRISGGWKCLFLGKLYACTKWMTPNVLRDKYSKGTPKLHLRVFTIFDVCP